MSCWSKLTQHEDVFLASCYISLSSVIVHLILDSSEIECHSLSNLFWMSGFNTTSIFVFQDVELASPSVMESMSSFDSEVLCYLELNLIDSQLWFRVVDHHVSICDFVWVEHVFVECNGQSCGSFVQAAACAEIDCLLWSCIGDKWNWRFMNDEDLLVLHLLVLVGVDCCQDRILDEAFWLVMMASVVVGDGGWQVSW